MTVQAQFSVDSTVMSLRSYQLISLAALMRWWRCDMRALQIVVGLS